MIRQMMSPLTPFHCNREDLVALQQQQDAIGWNMVKYGIMTIEWANVQVKWTQTTSVGHAMPRPGQWTKIVQDALWD